MRGQRLGRAHCVDIASDEGAPEQPENVAIALKFAGKIGQRRIQRVEGDRPDLSERQMHRHDDRRAGARAHFEIGEVDRRQIAIGLACVEPLRVHPERFALEAAGGGERRIERDMGIAPPRLLPRPAEHLARQHISGKVGRGSLVGNIVRRCRAHATAHGDVVQRLRCRSHFLGCRDSDRVHPIQPWGVLLHASLSPAPSF
ncbi:hypothetical protein D9M73_101410 [compost metagenome]